MFENRTSFSIQDVRDWPKKGMPKELYQPNNVRVLGAGGDDGANSPVVLPLIVPESIVILISPAACGRHCSVGSVFMGDPERMFFLRIQQQELVTGTYCEKLEKAIEELITTLEPAPKAVVICGSCSDVLLGSDYKSVAVKIEKKYGVRVTITGMEPILNDSRVNNFMKTEDAIYKMLRRDIDLEELNEVNIIGRSIGPDEESDLCNILKSAGIARVNHVTQFKTLKEYDRMSRARLNIAVEEKTIMAVRNLQKAFGTPYISIYNTYDVDEIHDNYQLIGKALGTTLDDTKYYNELKEKILPLKEKYGGLSVAVGESYSCRSPKAAVDVAKLGFSVKGLFVRELRKCDANSIEWLAENCPDMKVYFTGLPIMINYMKEPDYYDVAIGLETQYYANSPNTIGVSIPERYFDYRSLAKFIDLIEYTIANPMPPMPLGKIFLMMFGQGADVVPGCEKNFGMFKGEWK